MTHDETAPVTPDASIEVDDVDASYAAAIRTGAEIVHPLTDEPRGVRRFFVRDPDGHVMPIRTGGLPLTQGGCATSSVRAVGTPAASSTSLAKDFEPGCFW